MSDTRSRDGRQVAAGLLLGLCSSFASLAAVLLTPVLPLMLRTYADSPLPVPLIISAPALMVAVFAPFAGQIVDRVGRRKLLLWTLAVYAVIGTAPAWLPRSFVEGSIFGLLALRLLVGVCEAAIMTASTTLIADYFTGDRRNRYLGFQTVFSSVSAVVFIALGGVLGAAGWRTPFWVYAFSMVVLIPMLFLVREPRRVERSAASVVKTPWRRIWPTLLVTVFGGLAFFVLLAEASLVYTGVGITDTRTIGLISAGAAVATAIGSMAFPSLARFTAKALLPLAFGLLAAGLIVIYVSSGAGSVAGTIAGAIIGSFGSGLLLPTMLVWAVGRLGFAERGRATGWWQAAFFFGQFISPLVVQAFEGTGADASVLRLPSVMGGIGVACALIAVVLGILVRRSPLSATENEADRRALPEDIAA